MLSLLEESINKLRGLLLAFCKLYYFHVLLSVIFKLFFQNKPLKKTLRNTIRVSNGLDPDQD